MLSNGHGSPSYGSTGGGVGRIRPRDASQESRALLDEHEHEDAHSPTWRNFVHYVETGESDEKENSGGVVESDEARRARNKLLRATFISTVFMLVEVVGGYFSGSLAIMTDAAHLLSDIASFLVSLVALYLAQKKATSTLTFGYQRAEIVGAIISIMIIWFLTGILVWEAILRMQGILNRTRSSMVDGKLMFGIALFGLFSNLCLLLVLGHDHSHAGPGGHGHSHGSTIQVSHGHEHGQGVDHGHGHGQKDLESNKDQSRNINVSAAYVHALSDLLQSVGVVVAGALIWLFPDNPNVQLADPLCTFLFSVLVLLSTHSVLKTSVNVVMEGVPEGVDAKAVEEALRSIDGVERTHHLHIWSLTVGQPSLSVHLVVKEGIGMEATLQKAQHKLREFNIHHSTVQIESVTGLHCENVDCKGSPCPKYVDCRDGGCIQDFNENEDMQL